jgi:predicted TIM-barrel fold metal-dependent hydrolase
MTDNHIHIGQFEEDYYEAEAVFQVVLEAIGNVTETVFSSTTSCKDDILYSEVEKEIAAALALSAYAKKIKALCWYSPDYARQGIGIEKAMDSLPYSGIKIHPFAHNWDLNDTKTVDLARGIFDYADRHSIPVFIHTGYDKVHEAAKFSAFFGEFPNARFILAHGRPIEQTAALLEKFPNVYCDTAFMPEDDFKRIVKKHSAKILLGSDFPITYYYNKDNYQANDAITIFAGMCKQYIHDFAQMREYHKAINNLAASNEVGFC